MENLVINSVCWLSHKVLYSDFSPSFYSIDLQILVTNHKTVACSRFKMNVTD